MKYGDFSSLVQLGVGFHAGTALLQLYSDIGLAPLIRRIERIRRLVAIDGTPEGLKNEALRVGGDLEIFRIKHFNAYKKFVAFNFVVAFGLAALLVVMAFVAESELPAEIAFFIVAASILPGPITIGILWWESSQELKEVKERAERLEQQALRGS